MDELPAGYCFRLERPSAICRSNAHIFDDDFRLFWLYIHLYALLDIYSVGGIVRLPQEVVFHYVRPCFEANVNELATVSTGCNWILA